MKTADKKTAFTLVELMVSIMASAIVILTVAAVLLMAFRSWNTNNAYVNLRRDAAFAVELMARDIREAQSPTGVAVGPNSLTVDNDARSYQAVFELNPATGVIEYRRDGVVTAPFVARNVLVFNPELHYTAGSTDGVDIHLEMEEDVNDNTQVNIINETFVHMRN